MLEVQKLTKRFESASGSVTAVDSVSMAVPEATFASIVGRSGSGKSTLLSLLGALDKPTSGSIEVGNQNIAELGQRQLVKYRCKRIGFVFQNYNLVPNLTALENVMLPMEFAGLARKSQLERAAGLLDQVGLKGDKHQRKPGRLSGGEQQRVAIARALANRPKLILADEPTGNLDSATGKLIFDRLHQLAKSQKATVIVVTHDLAIAGRTDMIFKLADGKLIKQK